MNESNAMNKCHWQNCNLRLLHQKAASDNKIYNKKH